jgi:hypothetical protein
MSAAPAALASGRTWAGLFAPGYCGGTGAILGICVAASLCAALLWPPAAVAADDAPAQPTPQTSVTGTCRDCGVVRSIREIRTERKTSQEDTYVSSPQYLQARPFDQQPLVGPAITFSWGGNNQTQARVGAVGSPEMQQRFIDISYEITVRFDDGRYGLIEQQDQNDLRPGDRVKVVKGLVQRWQ